MTISRDALRSPAVGTGGNESRPVRVPRRVAAPVMVGRDAELDVLVEALATSSAVAVIEGEAGIGKTRLLAELAARPEMSGRRWLTGGCRRIREPFPLGPVIEAVRGLGTDERGGDGLAGARLSPVTGALRPLLPELTPWLPLAPEPLDDRAAERHRIFRGLTELLTAVGSVDSKAPVVLVLEDLHWADEQTAEFLTYLLGDPPKGLSVVLTYRGEEVDPSVRAVTAKLPASLRCAHVALEPMDTEQTGTLAAAILGAERVSGAFAEHLCGRASGVPFAIEELLALLHARGTLSRTPAGWARKAIDDLDIPSGIRDPVLERVSRMSTDARAVVEAAAVLQESAALSVLIRVSPASDLEAARGVEQALASGLLVERDGAIGFRHVLALQAVYESLTGPHRTDLHARAATALGELDRFPLGQLAHHLRRADRLEEWAVAAERAADRAVELGHDEEALRLLEDLLQTAALSIDERGRVAIKLARATSETFQASPDLVELLLEVAEQDLPRAARSELRFWLSKCVQDTFSDPTLIRRLLLEACEDLDGSPDLQAWAMLGLGIVRQPHAPISEQKMWLERVLELLPKVRNPVFRAYLLGKVAMLYATTGDPNWRNLTSQVEEQIGALPGHRQEINAYYSIGMAACYQGSHPIAQRLLGAALQGATACEHRPLEFVSRAELALLAFCRGHWDGLDDRVAVLLDELADIPLGRVDVELTAGCLALARGDLADSWKRLTDAARQAEVADEWALLPFALNGLARQAVVSGEIGDVTARVNTWLSAMEFNGYWASVVRALPAVTHLMIVSGYEPRASALVDRCERELAALDAPLAPAAMRHARGFLATGARDWTAAADAFLAAAKQYERLECPYEAAQAREHAAMAMFEMEDARAESTLNAALETYRRLGASWDEARCTRDARGHGLRIARPHRGGRKGYGEQLSPREDAVARLAAEGKTNKEIAAELFLTAATVNKHLGRAMRKLGVHSRAGVAGKLLELGGGAEPLG